MAILLTHVNNCLRLVGEQPLANTNSNQGNLVKQLLESALYSVVSQTRHSSFLSMQTVAVTAADYLAPAFSLPVRCVQLKNLFLQQTTNSTPPIRLVKLTARSLETLYKNYAYAVVGNSVYLGAVLVRPLNVTLEGYFAPAVLSLSDTDFLAIPDEAATCVEAVCAALLSTSYCDDFAQAAQLQKRADNEVTQLRARAGAMRAPISWVNPSRTTAY